MNDVSHTQYPLYRSMSADTDRDAVGRRQPSAPGVRRSGAAPRNGERSASGDVELRPGVVPDSEAVR